jgi:hypothetical protein
MTKC